MSISDFTRGRVRYAMNCTSYMNCTWLCMKDEHCLKATGFPQTDRNCEPASNFTQTKFSNSAQTTRCVHVRRHNSQ